MQHVAAFTHEAHPLAGQLLKLLSGQRAGGDARLIGGGAGGNMLMPELVHLVGVAGTQRLGVLTCLADVFVQARVIVLKLVGGKCLLALLAVSSGLSSASPEALAVIRKMKNVNS